MERGSNLLRYSKMRFETRALLGCRELIGFFLNQAHRYLPCLTCHRAAIRVGKVASSNLVVPTILLIT